MTATCTICPHRCTLKPGQFGLCRARKNEEGTVICENYGKLTDLALDPIEKKPLARFYPGSYILSASSYGCNMRCPFCQNFELSMQATAADTFRFSPTQLTAKALALSKTAPGNLGVAFTYNEPLVGYEYLRDCAVLLRRVGLKTVLVTNGMILEEPLKELLPLIDAMNIDLKGFTQEYYDWLRGDLATVKNTIALAAKSCHVEVTTLIVPGKNDALDEMAAEAAWLAALDPRIPLHISRFFPRYQVKEMEPTPIETIQTLYRIAREQLSYVYTGNC